jgi:hypothetical protein
MKYNEADTKRIDLPLKELACRFEKAKNKIKAEERKYHTPSTIYEAFVVDSTAAAIWDEITNETNQKPT